MLQVLVILYKKINVEFYVEFFGLCYFLGDDVIYWLIKYIEYLCVILIVINIQTLFFTHSNPTPIKTSKTNPQSSSLPNPKTISPIFSNNKFQKYKLTPFQIIHPHPFIKSYHTPTFTAKNTNLPNFRS